MKIFLRFLAVLCLSAALAGCDISGSGANSTAPSGNASGGEEIIKNPFIGTWSGQYFTGNFTITFYENGNMTLIQHMNTSGGNVDNTAHTTYTYTATQLTINAYETTVSGVKIPFPKNVVDYKISGNSLTMKTAGAVMADMTKQ